MSTLELYIWENRVIEVVMFIVKNMQIGIKLAGIIFSDNLIIETRREWEFEYCSSNPKEIIVLNDVIRT